MLEEDVHTEWFLSFEHEVDGAADFVGEDRKSLSFTVLADQPGVVVLCLLVSSQEKTSRFREGPLEVGVTDFAVFGAELLSC